MIDPNYVIETQQKSLYSTGIFFINGTLHKMIIDAAPSTICHIMLATGNILNHSFIITNPVL